MKMLLMMSLLAVVRADLVAEGEISGLPREALTPAVEAAPEGSSTGKREKSIFDYPPPKPANPLKDWDLWIGLFMIILYVAYVALYFQCVENVLGDQSTDGSAEAECADPEDLESGEAERTKQLLNQLQNQGGPLP